MKRVITVAASFVLALGLAGPVAAADYPEQAKPHSCDVVQSLPHDIIGHLVGLSPRAVANLSALVTDACLGG